MLRCKTTNHSGASGCSLQAQEDAVKAIQALDGLDWRSRTLKISQNKSRGSEGKAGLILESFTIIQPFFLLEIFCQVQQKLMPVEDLLQLAPWSSIRGWDFRFSTAEVHEHFRAEIVNPEEAILNDSDDLRIETDWNRLKQIETPSH